jgi:hypothetical protein
MMKFEMKGEGHAKDRKQFERSICG